MASKDKLGQRTFLKTQGHGHALLALVVVEMTCFFEKEQWGNEAKLSTIWTWKGARN